MQKRFCHLPPQYAVDFKIGKNPVRQLKRPSVGMELEVVPFTRGKFHGERISVDGLSILVLPRRAAKKEESTSESIRLTGDGTAPGPDGASLSLWLRPIGFVGESNAERMGDICAAVRTSWIDQFTFKEESQSQASVVQFGLRQPQIGAIHSTIGHWKMSEAPATVVMPTGTGKTETMVALTVHERPERVFIIVPSDVLRTQITDKFLTLGLLKQLGVCGPKALYPVVGLLKHQPKSIQELETFLRSCNVVVSTMNLVSRFTTTERATCAAASTHLFVDEAHHIRAATWEQFRDDFRSRRIVQFTATPFRNDGQHVDGRVVFNYPLRRAQAEKYFTPIRLLPVFEFDPDEVDKTIAIAAIKQLTDDIAAGHDHILLARVAAIPAAEQLIQLYNFHGKSFNPRLVHSKMSSSLRRECIADT
jgi:hypothetical protein